MYEKIGIADKKSEVKSQNLVPQIRRKSESSQSMNSPVDRILFLQRTIGNQAVQRLIKSGALQAKLRIGQPGDIYEQEADRVADHVMRMQDVSEAKDIKIQRKCPKCLEGLRGLLGMDRKDEKLQTKEIPGQTPEVTPQIEANINALRGGSQSLSDFTRTFFEPSFGRDFSRVRLYTDRAIDSKPLTQFPRYQGEVPSGIKTPLYAPLVIPSNTVHCVKKWTLCLAPYSPGSWAAKVTYHCPYFMPPIVLPGTTQTSYVTIPDEFIGHDPAGHDRYRCRPGSIVRIRTDIGDAFATGINRKILYPGQEACHAGYRRILHAALEYLFKPSGGGRPAGIRVNAPPPPPTIPCP